MASEPPKPGIDIGRAIGRGFESLKGNFLPFFAIALPLVGLPAFLNQYFVLSAGAGAFPRPLFGRPAVGSGDPSFIFSPAFWGPIVAAWIAILLGYAVLQVMLTRSTILRLSGREPDLAGSAALALRLLLPVIGLSICVGFLLILGFVCLIFPGLMIWCALIVALPVLVEEQGGVFASISRSRDLTRGSRWPIFLVVILLWVFSFILSTVAGVVAGISAAPLPDPIVAGAAHGIASTLTGLISTVVVAALYVELREVKEGAGTTELAAVFD